MGLKVKESPRFRTVVNSLTEFSFYLHYFLIAPLHCYYNTTSSITEENMKKISMLLVLFLAASFVLFAGGKQESGAAASASQFSGDYAFGGSTTVDPIIQAAIEEWKELYPDVHISYEGVGSSTGIKGIIAGTYSLGAASREPKDGEKAQGVEATHIALDAIAAIVNQSSVSISNISMANLASIYAGDITNWKEVGGPDAPIVVFNRDEASGTYETFEGHVMKKADKEFMASASVTTGNGDMAAKVGSTPYAIGYVGLGFTHEKGVKALTLEGIEPDVKNVYNKSYPVWRYLNVVHIGPLSQAGEVEQAFVDYLLSEDGQDIVEDLDFIRLP